LCGTRGTNRKHKCYGNSHPCGQFGSPGHDNLLSGLVSAHLRAQRVAQKACTSRVKEKACRRNVRRLTSHDRAFVRTQAPNRSAARAFALAASTARSLGGALVSSAWRRRVETAAISSTAAKNRASFIFDGLWIPLIFRTNWSEDARISSEVTGGSKLKRVLMFLHID